MGHTKASGNILLPWIWIYEHRLKWLDDLLKAFDQIDCKFCSLINFKIKNRETLNAGLDPSVKEVDEY